MRTVFYYCQTSSNIAAPDRATGTMWRVGAFRQWSDIGTVNVSLALRWSSTLMTVSFQLSNSFFLFQIPVPQPGLNRFVLFFNKIGIYTYT